MIQIEFFILKVICLDFIFNGYKQIFTREYRPPPFDLLCANNFINCFNILCDIDYVFTIRTDFISPNFNWHDVFDVSCLCSFNISLARFIVNNGVSQLMTESTHQHNTLDLLLVNDLLTVYNV